jgi:Na+/citrate or Na+/malate symporter
MLLLLLLLHYCYTASDEFKTITDFFYRLCSFLADNAVFLYLGMTLFGLNDIIEHFNYAFVCWAFFACLVSRAVSIVILAGVSTCMLLLSSCSYSQIAACWRDIE